MTKRFSLMFCGTVATAATIMMAACSGDDNDAGQNAADAASSSNDATTSPSDGGPDDSSAPDSASHDGSISEAGPFCTSTPCAVSLGVGGRHSCALLSDSTVRCWGDNTFGELGFGGLADGGVTPTMTATPTAATGVSGATSLAAGGYFDGEPLQFTCGAFVDGGAQCWGSNDEGEQSRTTFDEINPAAAPFLFSQPVKQIANGVDLTCVLTMVGDVACVGFNDFDQVDPATSFLIATPEVITATAKFTQISIGTQNVCAVSTDQHVWCWGDDAMGALGRAPTDGGLADVVPAVVAGLDNVVAVAGGYQDACAITTAGVAYCWGASAGAGLGRGPLAGPFYATPTSVTMPSGVMFKQISGNTGGFCALDTTGSVWCWGNNEYGADGPGLPDASTGEFSDSVYIPTKLPISSVDQISSGCGALHSCAVIHGGSVECWGFNDAEQLGTALVDGGPNFSGTPLDVSF